MIGNKNFIATKKGEIVLAHRKCAKDKTRKELQNTIIQKIKNR